MPEQTIFQGSSTWVGGGGMVGVETSVLVGVAVGVAVEVAVGGT